MRVVFLDAVHAGPDTETIVSFPIYATRLRIDVIPSLTNLGEDNLIVSLQTRTLEAIVR